MEREGRASWARDVGMESSRKCNCCTKAKEHKTVGAGIPSRMGDGFEGSSQNSSAFHHFGLYCSYSWGRGRAARAHYSLKRLGITVGIEFGLAARPAKRLRELSSEMPVGYGYTRSTRSTNGRAQTDEQQTDKGRRKKALEACRSTAQHTHLCEFRTSSSTPVTCP